MPVTPVHQLPYPSEGDIPDVPADMGKLAEAVDTALGTADDWHDLTIPDGMAGFARIRMLGFGMVAFIMGGTYQSKNPVTINYPAQYAPSTDQRLPLAVNKQPDTPALLYVNADASKGIQVIGNYTAGAIGMGTSVLWLPKSAGTPRTTPDPYHDDGPP